MRDDRHLKSAGRAQGAVLVHGAPGAEGLAGARRSPQHRRTLPAARFHVAVEANLK